MKISKTLVNEILKLSKADWEKVKTNIDYLFAKEEKNRNKTLYITEDSLKMKADYYPCYGNWRCRKERFYIRKTR